MAGYRGRYTWQRHALVLLPLILFAFVTRAWFTGGLIIGDDFSPPPSHDPAVLRSYFPWPSLWDSSYITGFDQSLWLPQFPLWAIAGLLARIGFAWPVIERLLWLFPLVGLIVIAPYVAAFRLNKNTVAAAVAALVFSLNTWTVGLIERGHISSLIAYALIPVVLLAADRVSAQRTLGRGLSLALLFTLQICFDIRYAYIAAALIASFGLARCGAILINEEWTVCRQSFRQQTPIWIFVLLSTLALNAYWIGTIVTAPNLYVSSIGAGQQLSTATNPETWLPALALYYPYYLYMWGTNPFASTAPAFGFYVIPLLVALSLAFERRRALALGVAALALSGIVLAALSGMPRAYLDRIPGMVMFRDPTKFIAIIALAYATAVFLGVNRVYAWLRPRTNGGVITAAAVALAIAYAFLMNGAFSPARFSNFSTLAVRPQDAAMSQFIERLPAHQRVLFFPAAPYAVQNTLQHPVLSASELQAVYPFLGEGPSLLKFIHSRDMSVALRQLGITTIVLSDDPDDFMYRSFGYNFQYSEALDALDGLKWLQREATFKKYVVFHVQGRPVPTIFQPNLAFKADSDPENAVAGAAMLPTWDDETAVLSQPLNLSGRDSVVKNVVEGLWRRQTGWSGRGPAAPPNSLPRGQAVFTFGPTAMRRALMSAQPVTFFKNDFYVSRAGSGTLLAFNVPSEKRMVFPAQTVKDERWSDFGKFAIVLNPPDASGAIPSVGLPLSTVKVQTGQTVRILIQDRRSVTQDRVARFSLFSDVNVPLASNPMVQLDLRSPGDGYNLWIEAVLNNRFTRQVLRVDLPAAGVNGTLAFNVRDLAQGQFDVGWQHSKEGKPHRWLRSQGLQYPRAASDYSLRSVSILLDAPAGTAVPDLAEMLIGSASIIATGAATPRFTPLQTTALDLRRSQTSVIGMSRGGITTTANSLLAHVTLAESPHEYSVERLQAGSFAFLTTAKGDFAGRVSAAQPGLLFLDSAGKQMKLPWEDLRAVRVAVPQSANISIGVRPILNASTLSFDAFTGLLDLTAAVRYCGRDGTRTITVEAPDSGLEPAGGINILSKDSVWDVAGPLNTPSLPLGIPLNLQKAHIGAALQRRYVVDVRKLAIENDVARDGVCGIQFAIFPSIGQQVAASDAEISISNVAIATSERQEAISAPALFLDHTSFPVSEARVRRQVWLAKGWHHIEGRESPSGDAVEGALILGSPQKWAKTGHVRDLTYISNDEISGLVSGSAPIVALSENYAPSWRLANIPSSMRLSGVGAIDFLRTRKYALPAADHFLMNDVENAWLCHDCHRVVFIYAADLNAYGFALLSLLSLVALIVISAVHKRQKR